MGAAWAEGAAARAWEAWVTAGWAWGAAAAGWGLAAAGLAWVAWARVAGAAAAATAWGSALAGGRAADVGWGAVAAAPSLACRTEDWGGGGGGVRSAAPSEQARQGTCRAPLLLCKPQPPRDLTCGHSQSLQLNQCNRRPHVHCPGLPTVREHRQHSCGAIAGIPLPIDDPGLWRRSGFGALLVRENVRKSVRSACRACTEGVAPARCAGQAEERAPPTPPHTPATHPAGPGPCQPCGRQLQRDLHRAVAGRLLPNLHWPAHGNGKAHSMQGSVEVDAAAPRGVNDPDAAGVLSVCSTPSVAVQHGGWCAPLTSTPPRSWQRCWRGPAARRPTRQTPLRSPPLKEYRPASCGPGKGRVGRKARVGGRGQRARRQQQAAESTALFANSATACQATRCPCHLGEPRERAKIQAPGSSHDSLSKYSPSSQSNPLNLPQQLPHLEEPRE